MGLPPPFNYAPLINRAVFVLALAATFFYFLPVSFEQGRRASARSLIEHIEPSRPR